MEYSGQLFLIVGNSGSGKDTLLREVLKRWPASARRIRTPRRYITRLAHDSEPFIAVSAEHFADMKQRGKFCLTWHIYDTDYGVPATIIGWLNQGDAVIVNVSRQIIAQARHLVPHLKVVFVSVPLEISRQRIRARRREGEEDTIFKQRLARAKENLIMADADFVVDNSVPLDEAAKKLLDYLLSFS